MAAGAFAQKAERDYIRKGNRFFNDSVFVDAEVNYRKALEANPKSTVSMYNLGNTLSQQQKFKEAMEQYVAAGKIEKDKMKLAHIYHKIKIRIRTKIIRKISKIKSKTRINRIMIKSKMISNNSNLRSRKRKRMRCRRRMLSSYLIR